MHMVMAIKLTKKLKNYLKPVNITIIKMLFFLVSYPSCVQDKAHHEIAA